MSNPMVKTEELTKSYPTGVTVLDGVTLTIESGEFVSILGPSGSGKTTLLNILGALDRPTEGRVVVDGEDLSKVRNFDDFRCNRVGFVFQLHNLIPTLNALENVQIPMCALKMSPEQRKQRALDLLEAVGLQDRLKHRPTMLSGGERQRVAIARALANSPRLVLADEPTGTLDPQASEEIMALMQRLNKEEGVTVALVTHDPQMAERTDRVFRLVSGRLSRDGGGAI